MRMQFLRLYTVILNRQIFKISKIIKVCGKIIAKSGFKRIVLFCVG